MISRTCGRLDSRMRRSFAIAGLVAQFLMTNFMNNIAQVELDFPADALA
jgi:hypothetical protein